MHQQKIALISMTIIAQFCVMPGYWLWTITPTRTRLFKDTLNSADYTKINYTGLKTNFATLHFNVFF